MLISAETGAAVQPLGQLEGQAKKTDSAMDKLGRTSGVTGETMRRGLVAAGSVLVGGALIEGVRRMVDGYAEAAKAAGDLANATGGSVQEVSAMQAALVDAGVSADKSAALLTKFTTQVSSRAGVETLAALNVELVKGAGGATDYAASMVKTVDAIMATGDASERNRQLVALFGRQGAAAFQDLMRSGMSLSEAMAEIDTGRIFTEEDLAKADAYDEAMDALAASTGQLGNTLGRTLAPMIATGAAAMASFVDVVSAVPGELWLVTGAVVALNRVVQAELVVGAVAAARTAMVGLGATVVAYGGLVRGVTAYTVAAVQGMGAALLANPAGLVIAGVAAAVGAFMYISGNLDDRAREIARGFDELTDSGVTAEAAISELARRMESEQNVVEGFVAGFRENLGRNALMAVFAPTAVANGIRLIGDALKSGGADADYYQQQLAKIVEEQGAMAGVTADAEFRQRELNDLLAEGAYSSSDLAEAVTNAGQAQAEKNRVDAEAKDLMAAYADSTWRAVDATLAQFDAEFRLNDAMAAVSTAIEKKGSNVDDVAQAALRAADAQAKLAEQTAHLAGETFTAADAHDAMIASLEKTAKDPDLTKGERKSIQDLIDRLREAQGVAGEGITVGGVTVDASALDTMAATLRARIRDAGQQGNQALVADLQAQLAALKLPETKQKVTVEMTTTGADRVKSTIDGLTVARTVQVHASLVNGPDMSRVLDSLAATRQVDYRGRVENAATLDAQLNRLARDRTSTIWVTYRATNSVPATGSGRADAGQPMAAATTAASAAPIYVQAINPMDTARLLQNALEGYAISVGREPLTARPKAW